LQQNCINKDSKMKIKSKQFHDVLGISSATLCLIHCLVFPLITILPIGLSHNHWIDLVFAAIGVYAIIGILKSKTPKAIKLVLLLSMCLILGSILYTLITHQHTTLLYIGGTGMIVGHLLNFRYHKH
jgi:hypothetical protein